MSGSDHQHHPSSPGAPTPDHESPFLTTELELYTHWTDSYDGQHGESAGLGLPSPPWSSPAGSTPISPYFPPSPLPSGDFWLLDGTDNESPDHNDSNNSEDIQTPYSPQTLPPLRQCLVEPYEQQTLNPAALDASVSGISLPPPYPPASATPSYLMNYSTPVATPPHAAFSVPRLPAPYPRTGPTPQQIEELIAKHASYAALDYKQGLVRCFDHGCGGRRFSSLGNFARHLREKSGQAKRFSCQNCRRSFSRSTAKNKHVKEMRCPINADKGANMGGNTGGRRKPSKK